MEKVEQYKELLSSLVNCINDEDITYDEEFGICYSAKLALNIERAEKMIKYGEYDSLDDVFERMAKVLEDWESRKQNKMSLLR